MNRVMSAQIDPQTARAYWTMSRTDSERAFRAARRHSRLVRVMRVAIPAGVVIATVAIFLMTYFNPLRMFTKLPVDLDNLVVAGTRITMEQPRLSGFTRDARAYEFTADAAAQDMTKPDIIELRNINAKMQMQNKSTVQMTAAKGVYDSKGETLKLDQNILISSSSGYEGNLSEATVDIRKGHVVSEQPVTLKMLQGTLDAKRLEIVDSGAVIRFDGGVNMTMMLNSAGDGPADKAAVQAGGTRRPR